MANIPNFPRDIQKMDWRQMGWDWCRVGYHATFKLNGDYTKFSDLPLYIKNCLVIQATYLDRRHIAHQGSQRREAIAICITESSDYILFYCDVNWIPNSQFSFPSLELAINSVNKDCEHIAFSNNDPNTGWITTISSWIIPHPDVVISRANIIECEIIVDDEGPDFIMNLAYGENNTYSNIIKAGHDSVHSAYCGWFPNDFLEYYLVGKSLEIWYLKSNPKVIHWSGPFDNTIHYQPLQLLNKFNNPPAP